jgi:hypothetical protein
MKTTEEAIDVTMKWSFLLISTLMFTGYFFVTGYRTTDNLIIAFGFSIWSMLK